MSANADFQNVTVLSFGDCKLNTSGPLKSPAAGGREPKTAALPARMPCKGVHGPVNRNLKITDKGDFIL